MAVPATLEYVCNHCGMEFKTESFLIAHVAMQHSRPIEHPAIKKSENKEYTDDQNKNERYREKMLRLGNCERCGKPRNKYKRTCDECQEKMRETNRKYQKRSKEKQKSPKAIIKIENSEAITSSPVLPVPNDLALKFFSVSLRYFSNYLKTFEDEIEFDKDSNYLFDAADEINDWRGAKEKTDKIFMEWMERHSFVDETHHNALSDLWKMVHTVLLNEIIDKRINYTKKNEGAE